MFSRNYSPNPKLANNVIRVKHQSNRYRLVENGGLNNAISSADSARIIVLSFYLIQ